MNDSKRPPQSQPPLPYEDEVLRRMLSSPPKPHKVKQAPDKTQSKKPARKT